MKLNCTVLCFFRRVGVLSLSLLAAALRADAVPGVGTDDAAPAVALPEVGRIVIESKGPPPPVPVFFSAAGDEVVRVGAEEITGETRLRLHVLQGRPDVLTLGLSGEGEVTSVVGRELLDWSVRRPAGPGDRRLLDVRVRPGGAPGDPRDFELAVRTRLRKPALPGTSVVLIAAPGSAVGFSLNISLEADPGVDLRVTAATGMVAVAEKEAGRAPTHFLSSGEGRLEVGLTHRGAAIPDAEFLGARLAGGLSGAGASVDFQLTGQLRTRTAGARLRVLSGRAALSRMAAGEGWHVELVALDGGGFAYDLVGDREGVAAVDIAFAAQVAEDGDWRRLEFTMPAGAVVPLELSGVGAGVTFNPDSPLVPTETRDGWRGFLPASGLASLSWKHTAAAAEGTLFFTSSETSDVRVGAGLLRQTMRVRFRILQGKLGGVTCRLEGPGEILGVEGTNVVGWKVVPLKEGRELQVRLSRPMEAEGALTVHSQTELGGFPLRTEPLRLIPEGGVRHSGFVRIANSGSVRLGVDDLAGMMQLAPSQFPGPAPEDGARQVFVYRFPSASYGYHVIATQIQPEVAVSEITTYELSETDRVISASLELDVREAPVREWSVQVPDDYTVASVTGGGVSDFAAETTSLGGYRTLRIVFGRAVEGRQLLQLRLEKNLAAAAGGWPLRPIRFPDAKSVRGHIGVVSSPGYRIAPAGTGLLAEIPLSYFPRQTAGLQQAWRLRGPEWKADVRIEALGQSIQADVFHLYSITEGIMYGSVLLNYFVVGAPATEWRVEIPPSVGNIDVVGQNVQRDWRREGNQVIVSLHKPVLGPGTLLITFQQPISARGGLLEPGQVRPLGVQAERGYVEIVSPLQVKFAVRKAEGGLIKLDPLELPAEFRLLSSAPALAVYQYAARPFRLEMGVEWYAQAETVEQVVDFATLSSQVSRDGQVVTTAQYFVKTRGRKALRVVLPPGVTLWETRVEGEEASAEVDGDQTLIPLPAKANAGEPVSVLLRFGQPAGTSAPVVRLTAPRTLAPSVMTEWTLRPDPGLLLIPRGGSLSLVRPALTESGFEWIRGRAASAASALLCMVGLGVILLTSTSSWRLAVGLMLCAAAVLGSSILAAKASVYRRSNLHELTYASTMVSPAEGFTVQVENVAENRGWIVGWGVFAVAAGVAASVAAGLPSLRGRNASRPAAAAAATLLSAGVLAQHGGAPFFFAAVALAVLLVLVVPGSLRWERSRRAARDTLPERPGAGASPAVPLLALMGCAGLVLGVAPRLSAEAVARPASWLQEGNKAAESMVEKWTVRNDRLFAEVELTVRGVPGDSFLLLRPPAMLTEFTGEGLRVGKVERDGQTFYYVAPERAGTLVGHARFEMAAGSREGGFPVPTGPAATQRITLELDQAGWDFTSAAAMEVTPTPGLGGNRSGATLVLAPGESPRIMLRPRHRDTASEPVQFYAEASNLFVPGPGVVDGFTRFTIRPVQGRVSGLDLAIPAGLTVGDVHGPVGTWRFDPASRRLHVAVEPAQTDTFTFDVETQLGAGALPFDLSLEPLRVDGAVGQVGKIAVAFGAEAQPESLDPSGLTPVNAQDFDATLLPRARGEIPAAALQQAWAYGQTGGRLGLRIVAVAPEVRVTTRQILSLDDDRMVIAVDLGVSITRAGLFNLSFAVPEGLELESLSGNVLSQWTEAQEGAQRVVTMHLNGRTLGDSSFAMTLAGPSPRAQADWSVPRVRVREASRQTGEALLIPGKGLRLRVVDRSKVAQIDPASLGGAQPGTLAFRLLQEDWSLHIGIEALEPWVTVRALQEVTVREGQTLTRMGMLFRVENSAVRQVRVRLPGLGKDAARTVRATGSAVSDVVSVDGAPDLWEIRFQRGIAGETDVQVEFQEPTAGDRGRQSVVTPEFPGTRQAVQFVAVRGSGRLELAAGRLPRGWVPADWASVPANLQDRADRSSPALCFRVAEPEGGLGLAVSRHDIAEALRLRVTEGDLTTVFSAAGSSLTMVQLKMEVLEKSTLRLRLPGGARLFSTFVNGESVSLVREGEAYLFHVSANTGSEHAATVRLAYAASGSSDGAVRLVGPSLSIPLENVTWRVVVPPSYAVGRYKGDLRLQGERFAGMFGVEDYKSLVQSRRSSDAQKAVAMLEEANAFLQSGDQQRAGEMLSRASNAQLDEASNEDARVQLRNLKTQQTVLGLNTRRQRLYLDNRVGAPRNDQLEQAASLNPFMRGKVNFDPQEVDQLLLGNTVEENTALHGIAACIVDQQLAAEPPPSALDVTVPERGRVLTFTRSLQVDGGEPLELRLTLASAASSGVRTGVLMVLAIASIAALASRRPAALLAAPARE